MKFMAAVWAPFLARQRPVSTNMKPACMNITRKPVIIVHTMLMEKTLCAIRSYRSVTPRLAGASPLPSPAGVAHTPAAPPVWSGQVGLAGSAFAPAKYDGSSSAAHRRSAHPSPPAVRPTITTSHSQRAAFDTFMLCDPPSDCIVSPLARSDAHGVVHRHDEDLPVADAPRARR